MAVANVKGQLTDADKNINQLIVSEELLLNIKSYSKSVKTINTLFNNMRNNFFDLGKELSRVKESKSYKGGNYKDIYDFSKSEFNLEVTSTKNFINVYLTFKGKDDELSEKFEGFNLSQLVEMLPLADDKKFCSQLSSLTVKEIKSIKRNSNSSDVTVEGKWNSLIPVVKNIVLNDICSNNKKLVGKYHDKGVERCNPYDPYDSIVILLDGYGRLYITLTEYADTIDLEFSVDTFVLNFYGYNTSSFKHFKENIKEYIERLISKTDEAKKEAKKEAEKEAEKVVPEKESVTFVESEVVDDAVPEKEKVCTLKNDSLRSEFIANVDNWEFIGSVTDHTTNGLRLGIYRFKVYPKFLKVSIGHPKSADEFDHAKLFYTGPSGSGFYPLTSDRYIVDRLKRERY